MSCRPEFISHCWMISWVILCCEGPAWPSLLCCAIRCSSHTSMLSMMQPWRAAISTTTVPGNVAIMASDSCFAAPPCMTSSPKSLLSLIETVVRFSIDLYMRLFVPTTGVGLPLQSGGLGCLEQVLGSCLPLEFGGLDCLEEAFASCLVPTHAGEGTGETMEEAEEEGEGSFSRDAHFSCALRAASAASLCLRALAQAHRRMYAAHLGRSMAV
mmetsp:Transcript_25964/g.70374  ORF Transcript_25964/g.70374 Transcript_25964/m.70374 type:complete len:213 (-) Transcript_25964:883-1521(-)